MKKFFKALTLFFCSLIFVVTPACSSATNNNIKKIDGHNAIYRYNVKEIQLLKDGTETEEILEKTNEYKYYYSAEKNIVYFTTHYLEDKYKSYFPEASLISKYDETYGTYMYSEKYSCKVYICIVLNGIGKTYYPTYTSDNNFINITYYETTLYRYYAFKKEMTATEKEKIDYRYDKDLYESRNDEKKKEKIKANYEKYDFENTAIIKTIKYSIVSNTYNLIIDYED